MSNIILNIIAISMLGVSIDEQSLPPPPPDLPSTHTEFTTYPDRANIQASWACSTHAPIAQVNITQTMQIGADHVYRPTYRLANLAVGDLEAPEDVNREINSILDRYILMGVHGRCRGGRPVLALLVRESTERLFQIDLTFSDASHISSGNQ